jgi:predicted DsbA family dithiol-disulfide isomerase
MKVEIWSDVVCPWCYIGKRRFEKALAGFEHAADVSIEWRSFELDPRAAPVPGQSMVEQVAGKFGRTLEDAGEILASIDRMAAEEGLDYDLAKTTGGNTFDAHRLIHLANERGLGGEFKEALLHAYFVERVAVSDHDVLRRVAADVGLPNQEVDEVLSGERYADAVRADEDEARELGATGVPFVVVDRALAVPGAQDPDTFLAVLRQAWDRSHPSLTTVDGAGSACDGDSCPAGTGPAAQPISPPAAAV